MKLKGLNNLDWGMKNRLSKLVKEDGHCFFLPIDHGYFQGPTHCLENPGETIKPLLKYADGLFVTRGTLRACIEPDCKIPVILRVSGGPSVIGKLENEEIVTSIEDVIRLNATSVGMSIFVGTEYETKSVSNLAKLVNICEPYGIPVMAVTAVGKELDKRDARYLGLASRIAAEHGAKIVKTYYCEDFDKVVDGCPVPVVIAGGPKCETEMEVFNFVYDGMQKGAIGLNLGRNVWQHKHPAAMMKALRAIIHKNASPEDAAGVFENAKK